MTHTANAKLTNPPGDVDQATEQKLTRRQIFAFIALTNAPSPKLVIFYDEDHCTLEFERPVDMKPWTKVFPDMQDQKPFRGDSGSVYHRWYGYWGGWTVSVSATEPPRPKAVVEPIDADTRTQLAQVVAGGAE